jgi:hypothetical protein
VREGQSQLDVVDMRSKLLDPDWSTEARRPVPMP